MRRLTLCHCGILVASQAIKVEEHDRLEEAWSSALRECLRSERIGLGVPP